MKVKIAREILSLIELAQLARPFTWVSFEEFGRVHAPNATDPASVERNAMRLAERLRAWGLALAIQRNPEGDPLPVENRYEWRIHVASPEILDFLEPLEREARTVEELWDAKQQRREPDLAPPELDAEEIIVSYRVRLHGFARIRRRTGSGHGLLRKILLAGGVELRAPRISRIEVRRPSEVVARALDLADQGAHLDRIAEVLRPCTRWTAARFLRRHGRQVPAPGRPRGVDDAPG